MSFNANTPCFCILSYSNQAIKFPVAAVPLYVTKRSLKASQHEMFETNYRTKIKRPYYLKRFNIYSKG